MFLFLRKLMSTYCETAQQSWPSLVLLVRVSESIVSFFVFTGVARAISDGEFMVRFLSVYLPGLCCCRVCLGRLLLLGAESGPIGTNLGCNRDECALTKHSWKGLFRCFNIAETVLPLFIFVKSCLWTVIVNPMKGPKLCWSTRKQEEVIHSSRI